jgi:hypothetical protein
MSFQYRPKMFSVTHTVILNNLRLNYTVKTKFLGVYTTETLKWSTHTQSLANKLCNVAFMIKSLTKIMSPYVIHNIYFSKFQSQLRCGILFWGGLGGIMSTKLFRLQKKVIRFMVWVNSRTSCKQLFKDNNILTLVFLYVLEVICYIKRYCQSLELNADVNKYDTRRKMDIHVQSSRTDKNKNSVISMGTKLYNKLPSYIKELDNFKAFKREFEPRPPHSTNGSRSVY